MVASGVIDPGSSPGRAHFLPLSKVYHGQRPSGAAGVPWVRVQYSLVKMAYQLYNVEWFIELFDTYDFMVVCASSEQEARNWHPAGFLIKEVNREDGEDNPKFIDYLDYSKVTHIGTAVPGLEPGVIVASYNAR